MENSTFNVYNVYHNLVKMAKLGKEIDVYNACFSFYHARETYLYKFKKIYNDIENHYYGYREYIIFLLYNLLFKNSIKLSGDLAKQIKTTITLFTRSQLKKDQELIIQLNQKLQLKPDPVIELFKLRETGFSIVYKLIMKKQISPIFFMTYANNILTKKEEDDILKHDDYIRFEFLIQQLKKYVGGFYE